MSAPTTTEAELLDDAAIARITGVTLRMAQRLIYERRVPVVKIGRYLRVRRSDLDAWLDANTQPAVTRR